MRMLKKSRQNTRKKTCAQSKDTLCLKINIQQFLKITFKLISNYFLSRYKKQENQRKKLTMFVNYGSSF